MSRYRMTLSARAWVHSRKPVVVEADSAEEAQRLAVKDILDVVWEYEELDDDDVTIYVIPGTVEKLS